MKNNRFSVFTKFLLALTTLSTLMINSVPIVLACGPNPIIPVFDFHVRPDDLRKFSAGELGILKPNYARSYLIVAYRILNGHSLSTEEQKQVVSLWNYRLGIDESERGKSENIGGFTENENDVVTALQNWSEVRTKVVGPADNPIGINDLWKYDSSEFTSYVNCTKSGFETAAKTLRNRLEQYPNQIGNIREWVKGQDAVFSNCSGNGQVPSKTENDTPLWLQKDRDYQFAAAMFYSGRFDLAKKHFEQISNDDLSVWKAISDYLVARTLLRKASFDKPNSEKLIEEAESHLAELLRNKDMSKVHRAARQLQYVAANRTKTKDHFKRFSRRLSSSGEVPKFFSEVETYTNYLDKFGFKPKKEEAKSGDKVSTVKNEEQTFWEWLWTWIFGEDSSETNKSADIKSEKINSSENTDSEYYYDEPKLKNSMHFRSDIDFENVSEVARQEDISDWIFTFQANDKEAFAHALKKWQKTSKSRWLLAAISAAEIDYDGSEKLIDQANEIKPDSPAFLTIKYHQVRLLIEQNKFETARNILDGFLNIDKNKMPISTQNSFFGERMLVAKTLDEFVQYAKRKPIAYSAYSSFYDETSWIRSNIMDTRDVRMLSWRNRWMFDTDSTEIFNKSMPLELLIKAGKSENIPAYLRKGILISAWTRAVLLKDKRAQIEATELLIKAAPEMSKALGEFRRKPNELTTNFLLLKYPVMQPLVDTGFARFTIPSNSLSYDRNNWWYREELESKNPYLDKPFMPGFLNKDRINKAESERKALYDKGHSGNMFAENAVKVSKKFPNAKELPEMLHRAVQSTRYGDSNEAAKHTKAAFQILHNRFPKSIWAKKTKYWYN